ncbi:MAG: MarR family winged helix-turn-helix transcriptional regulator [Methylophilaceae bacterium]
MTRYENLALNHQLCFALYAATHAITRAYRTGLEQAGLTYTQYLVMMVLWEKDAVSVGRIAQKLDLDSATLTPLLKRLETSGFIERKRNNDDERIVEISLTKAGDALQDQIAKVQNGVECQTGLNKNEFVALKATLNRLVEAMSPSEEKIAA